MLTAAYASDTQNGDMTDNTSENTRNGVSGGNTDEISIEAGDKNVYPGEQACLEYEITPPADDGIMTYYLDGEVINIQNLKEDNSTYRFNTTHLKSGEYNLTYEYSDIIQNLKAYKTVKLNIMKFPSTITDFSTCFDESNRIQVTFNLKTNHTNLKTGTITLHDNNNSLIRNITVNTTTGITFTIPSIYNNKIVKLTYTGDEYHQNTTTEKIISIEKYRCGIYLPKIRGYHGDIKKSNITFNTNHPITDGNINLYIDNSQVEQYDITDNTCTITTDLNRYPEGNYTVKIKYLNSNIFKDTTYNTTLRVDKIPTKIYAGNITAYKRTTTEIKALITNPIENTNSGIAEYFIDNQSIYTAEITSNNITLAYTIPEHLNPGKHNLTIKYHGTQRYKPSILHAQLNIHKHPVKISVKNITTDNNGTIQFTLHLKSNKNTTITDGQIKIKEENRTIIKTDITTDTNNIKLPGTYRPGRQYNLTLQYHNSTLFEDTTDNIKINIPLINTTIKITAHITNNILNITTHIQTKDNSKINTGNIQIKLNNTTIDTPAITNSKTNTLHNMTNHPPGRYKITATYNQTRKYTPNTNTTTINYKPNQKNTYIKTNNTIKATPGETITIQATLQDHQNPINTTINTTIKIGNKTYKTQFKNSKLQHNHTINPGTNDQNQTITITTTQTPQYKTTTKNITLIIKRKTLNINTKPEITITKQETIKLNYTITHNNKPPDTPINITIKLNGKTQQTQQYTNNTQQITIPMTKHTNNKYTLTITTTQTPQYKTTTKNITITTQKRKTHITTKNIQTQQETIINATIHDTKTGKPITTNTKTTIKINNKTYTKQKTQNANIIKQYTNKPGTYNITIISGENNIYQKTTWNGQITIKKPTLQIITQNIKTQANNKININAKILKNNKPLNTPTKIIIKINQKTITTLTTTNGTINHTYQLTDKYPAKQHNLTITIPDTNQHQKTTKTIKLTITKLNIQIKTTNITTTQNNTIKLTINITDQNKNKNIKNLKINIKIAKKTITTTTLKENPLNITYKLPPTLKKGYHTILIQTSNTQIYNHATMYTTLQIK